MGAAVAVVLGGGGLLVANAAPSDPGSTFIPIDPVRVLDTRAECSDGTSEVLTSGFLWFSIVGTEEGCNLAPEAVPIGATAAVLNVTVVRPTAAGFVSIRPWKNADFVTPTISQLNFEAGQVVPNAVTVALPVAGEKPGVVELYYGTRCQCLLEELPIPSGHYTDILIDVVGYYVGAPVDVTSE